MNKIDVKNTQQESYEMLLYGQDVETENKEDTVSPEEIEKKVKQKLVIE